eukprot:UN01489
MVAFLTKVKFVNELKRNICACGNAKLRMCKSQPKHQHLYSLNTFAALKNFRGWQHQLFKN